ncbi:MAG: DUF1294 domain-containing protein [Firmicutes bacterium]|nr:DUF1294 domain-containing protein [Bacillota bacterium]
MIAQALSIYLLCVNLVAVLLMRVDKRWARRRRRRRIRERTLLVLTVVGGAPGVWLGMRMFRHKTKHAAFRILAPLMTAVWAILLLWLVDVGFFSR